MTAAHGGDGDPLPTRLRTARDSVQMTGIGAATPAKRPRGRPPKDPRASARRRQQRDAQALPERPAHSDDHIEAWVEAHGERYWCGRGRPPAGAQPLLDAVCERFAVSRSTAVRAIRRIRSRRAAALARTPVDPATAQLLQALHHRYRNGSSSSPENGSRGENAPQPLVSQALVTQRVVVGRPPLLPKIDQDEIRSAVLAVVRSWPAEDDLLGQVRSVLDDRLGCDAGRGRSAPPSPSAHSVHLHGMPSPSAIAHEALLEAIDAYLAMARPPQNLARVLEAVRAHLAAPSAVTGSATTPSAGGATGEMAGRRTA